MNVFTMRVVALDCFVKKKKKKVIIMHDYTGELVSKMNMQNAKPLFIQGK